MTEKRWTQVETADLFRHALELAMGVSTIKLDSVAAAAIWRNHKSIDGGRPKAVCDGESTVIFLYKPTSTDLAHALRVTFPVAPSDHDVHFCRCMSKIFNEDMVRCVDTPETDELWETLSMSRTARAIARFVPFLPHSASEWLRLLESSTSLTYEGTPVRYTVLFAKDFNEIAPRLGSLLVRFREPLEMKDALLTQKWIRTAVDSQRLALVVTKKQGGRIAGLVSYSALPLNEPDPLYAPHESLLALQAFLVSGEMAMTVSPHGDLWILLKNGIVFAKSQGVWFYINYSHAHTKLMNLLGKPLAIAILRAALDLSFERKGALLCIPDNDNDVDAMAPDRIDRQRVNHALRDSIAGLSVLAWEQRQVIAATASIDGATVLSRDGTLLDVACMVARPSPEVIRTVTGSEVVETHAGARSTAAWNASIFGTSIKISEDGPITIYRHGKRIACIGGAP